MKATVGILMVSASLVAGAAQAASVNSDTTAPKTRAQVVAELQQAQAQGLISQNKLDYPVSLPATQHKSREQVVAELAAAESAGLISQNSLDYPVQTVAVGSKSRAEVVNQLVAYQDAHPFDSIANRH